MVAVLAHNHKGGNTLLPLQPYSLQKEVVGHNFDPHGSSQVI